MTALTLRQSRPMDFPMAIQRGQRRMPRIRGIRRCPHFEDCSDSGGGPHSVADEPFPRPRRIPSVRPGRSRALPPICTPRAILGGIPWRHIRFSFRDGAAGCRTSQKSPRPHPARRGRRRSPAASLVFHSQNRTNGKCDFSICTIFGPTHYLSTPSQPSGGAEFLFDFFQ